MTSEPKTGFFARQPVLVTGGTGLVGSNLIQRLLQEGAKVRATLFDREPIVKDPRVEYVRADLTKREDCARVASGIRYAFLCAASVAGAQGTARTPMNQVNPNILINTCMLEACYAAGAEKVLWLSSTTVYPTSDAPMREEDVEKGDPFEKYYFFGWMSRFTEILCRMYGEKLPKKMTTIVLRPTAIYGPQERFDWSTAHVIPSLIRKVVERWDPLEVWGDGSEIRDPVYVDDVVAAMVQAMERVTKFNIYNIGLGKGYSVKQILQTILKLDGFTDARVQWDASKPTMIPVRLVDIGRAKADFGFRPTVDLEEGLRRTLAWYRANPLPREERHLAG